MVCIQCSSCILYTVVYSIQWTVQHKQTNKDEELRSMWCDWEDISHGLTMPGLYCCVCSGQFPLSRLSSPSVSCILIVTGGLEGRGSCILATSGDGMRLGRIYYLIIQTIMPWSGQSQHTLLSILSDRQLHTTSQSPQHYALYLLIKVQLCQLYSALH